MTARGLSRVDVLSVDTEGHDPLVLVGASRALKLGCPVVALCPLFFFFGGGGGGGGGGFRYPFKQKRGALTKPRFFWAT